ncbi:MAG: PRC-barrel domain-containing protein [Candidatus Bathyarchaeota archaeon]|nr:PRC-barrel domain-containing protein [Candidatus Bathyarchaeota archaeon]
MEKNQKSIPKDKLIGMQVIDAEGNLVGKVKDVSFVIGQPSISLNVEDKSGKATDISWERVQGAADFIVLKPTPQTTAAPEAAAQSAQPVCPTCGGPLTYIQQYKRWYCYKDQKYV